MSDRNSIIEKIRKLRARANDAASSQSEVEFAAMLAAKLISENEVSEAELAEKGLSGICEGSHNKGRRTRHDAVRYAIEGITKATQTEAYFRGGEQIFVGEPTDVEFAIYLCELVQSSADRGFKKFAKTQRYMGYVRQKIRPGFLVAFGKAVGDKLWQIGVEREQKMQSRQTSGTNLIVVKDALIEQYVDENWGTVREEKSRSRKFHGLAAQLAGAAEGARLNIERPLEKQHAQPALA